MAKQALAFLLLLPLQAQAANCYPLLEMIERLQEKGQEPWGGGMRQSGHVQMIWVNPETRDWTAVWRPNRDYLCINSEGQGWARRKPEPEGKPS